MLNLNVRDTLHPLLKQLLTDFRRVQVSRFPIEVVQHSDDDVHAVRFTDSRFPNDAWRKDRILAYLSIVAHDSKNRPKLMLYSRLISNDKYSNTNDEHHQKITTDPKKMASWLREYVKPYSQEEIMARSSTNISYDHEQWRYAPRQEFRNVVQGLTPDDLAEEILYLQSVGVQFRSEKFQQVATQGLDLYAESKRRLGTVRRSVHVFMQPDGSALVTASRENGFPAVMSHFETLEGAPEAIQQQVAMLRLCERGQYIPEVGRMVTDREFWVLVSPSDLNIQNA